MECDAERFVEAQIYNDIVVLVSLDRVKIVVYKSVELKAIKDKDMIIGFEVGVSDISGDFNRYCVERFNIHPYATPSPLWVIAKIVKE